MKSAIYAVVGPSLTGDPAVALMLRRRLPFDSYQFRISIPWLARNGDSEGIRAVLARHKGSVHDTDTAEGVDRKYQVRNELVCRLIYEEE